MGWGVQPVDVETISWVTTEDETVSCMVALEVALCDSMLSDGRQNVM